MSHLANSGWQLWPTVSLPHSVECCPETSDRVETVIRVGRVAKQALNSSKHRRESSVRENLLWCQLRLVRCCNGVDTVDTVLQCCGHDRYGHYSVIGDCRIFRLDSQPTVNVIMSTP